MILLPAMLLIVAAVALTFVCTATLWWMMFAWRTPESHRSAGFPDHDEPQHSFSIIMPCRDELEEVMAETLNRLLTQSHLDVEVVLSVGHDDLETVANAQRLAARHPDRVKVSINYDLVKNKPSQLNTALQICTKEIVGVMDAESLARPELLRGVDATFRARGADVVQGAVHLVNYRSRWFSLRNCLEYRIWFRSRLLGHAAGGFIPLGGNTVFVWRELLNQVGGWDGNCLAEDCDLGVRLSVLGKRVVCVYDPALTTLEETPATVKAFIKQRTRWALGFMQVMSKGDWKRMPTRRRRLAAWWMLSQQYATAAAGVLLPLAFLTAVLLRLPTGIVMLTYVPLIPLGMTVLFEVLVLHDFGRDMGYKITVRDYAVLVISTPFYQALLLWAALVAVFRFRRGNFSWDKTPHEGTHLTVHSTAAQGAAA
jgi:cellulose synthase/poly-beta-1,6-N-acetylglucosamine synthase-like glycosyltransferase